MASPSPTRSSPTLHRYLQHESGSKSSHSQSIYARAPTKPKKFQSAHYDETTGTWRCKHCGYTYPNSEPQHHQRRAHKKICQGGFGNVHRWLFLSGGEEAEDAQDSSNVVHKPTRPESSDSATTQGALGHQDKNAGFEVPQLGDQKGALSDQHGLLAAGENSKAPGKEELDSEPVTKDFKPGTRDLGRLLTLDSDVSLPHGFPLDRSDPVDFSGVASSDFVPASDVSASGNQQGVDSDGEEPLKRTDVAQGVQSTSSSSNGSRLKDSAPDGLGDSFHQREHILNAADDDTQEKTAHVLQQVEESQTISTEDRNAEELMGEGFGETEAILPAAADDGALMEKEEEIQSEQGIISVGGDGAADKSGDEHESSHLVRGAGDEEASQHASAMDQSGHVVHVTEEVDGIGGHIESAEVDAISLEPLSDDAEGVTETPPNTSRRSSVKLSAAERNWDNWEHVVHGDDTSGQGKLPSLPQEIDDEGPSVSEDGLTSSQSDSLEDNTADTDAPMLESPGTAVLTSDQEGVHEIGFHPADVDWISAFPDTVNMEVHKEKPVDSLERSSSADIHSSPDQDRQELIPGLGEEIHPQKKVALRLSAAEANWDDWEDVIKRGPMLMEGITFRKDQDPESSGGNQTRQVDSLGEVSGFEQGKTGTTISDFESFAAGGVTDMIQTGQMLVEGITLRKAQDPESPGEFVTPQVDSLGDVSGLGQGKTGIVSEFESFVEGGVTDVIEAGQKLMKGLTLRKVQDPESSGEYETPQVDSLGDVSGLGQSKTGGVSEFESIVESGVTDLIKSGDMLMEGISLRKAQDPESLGEYQTPQADSLGDVTGLGQRKTGTVSEVESFVEGGVANVIKRGLKLLEGITFRKAQDPKSSGDLLTPRVDSHGDVSELGQGTTGTSLESESFVEGGGIDIAAAASLPVHIPEGENSDWLIDFSEPSVEEKNPGSTNQEAIAAIGASSPKLEVPGIKVLDLLDLNEGFGHERGASLLDSIPVTPQSETGQSRKVGLSKLSSALTNWEDWDDVVRESERLSRPERSSPVLESDLGDGEHENGLESPNHADSNIVDSGSNKRVGSVEPLETPPVASNSDTAMNSEQEIDGMSRGKQPDAMVTSVPDEGDLLRFPKAKLEPEVSRNSLPMNLNVVDSGLGSRQGRKDLGDNEDTSRYESVQPGVDNLWEDNWEVGQRNEYPPAGSRHSSPSFEDTHDGELSSEPEFPTGLPTAVNLPLGTRRWADWEDLTKSEYMVLDGPDGESLVFKRTADARDKLSAKALGGKRETPTSLDEPDEDDGGSPSLRRRRRQAPSFKDDRSRASRALNGASPRAVVKSDYTAGSNSFQGFETTPRSLPASSPRNSESGDLAPLVTRRPLIYRGSRRDYTSEVEDLDVTSEPPLGQHLHHHNLHEHNDALKYDVEKVLRGQTTYELICPICGALITRKIIIRKKKRRFVSEGDSRWRRETSEITPVEDDGHQSSRSDMSSDIEDLSGAWKQGIRPCLGYFFGS